MSCLFVFQSSAGSVSKSNIGSALNQNNGSNAGLDKGKDYKLQPDTERQLKEAFAVIDVGKDGKIDAEELMIILNAVTNKNMSIEEVQKLIADVDVDGGGEIDEDEFLALMNEQMKDTQQDEELIAAFKFFGAENENDSITFETLRNALNNEDNKENEQFTDEELEIIFNETAGASSKPITQGATGNVMQESILKNNDEDENQPKGINFKDFMLMMMAK